MTLGVGTRIGIVGPIGSGKSFLANQLAAALFQRSEGNTEVVIMPFAQILKEICSLQAIKILFNRDLILYDLLTYHGLHSPVAYARILEAFEEYPSVEGEKNRKLLQFVGTDIVREIDPDFWINATNKRLESYFAPDDVTIVIHDDVRFANEAALCDIIIELIGESTDDEAGTHASEQGEWREGKAADLTIRAMYSIAELATLVNMVTKHESFMRD